jgi:hypothetical protein
VTKFQDEHPGKYQVLAPRCPYDASHSPFHFPWGCARLACADYGCANRWKEKYVLLRERRYLPAKPVLTLCAQFSSVWPERTPRSSSGSITMRAF